MYVRRPVRAAGSASPRTRCTSCSLNKYYVDELYDALFVRPSLAAVRVVRARLRPGLIDGAVNGVGRAVVGVGARRCAGSRPASS